MYDVVVGGILADCLPKRVVNEIIGLLLWRDQIVYDVGSEYSDCVFDVWFIIDVVKDV